MILINLQEKLGLHVYKIIDKVDVKIKSSIGHMYKCFLIVVSVGCGE